ncbi:MAG: M28 family peptidase [Myxococcales bacterium]|nr:M28 family peptidase [Myxococcales bacterium]
MTARGTWEETTATSTAGTLASIVRRLPGIWAARRRARQLAAGLPVHSGPPALPDLPLLESWLRGICRTPHRRPGTPEGRQAEEWVADRLREFGLADVTLDPIPIEVWTADRWSLTVGGRVIPSFFIVNTAFTGDAGLAAPLVYVGTGTAADFAGTEVGGKIVVADVPFPRMPTGLLMKVLRASYALSDPDRVISPWSSQYLNFVRQNFIGGAASAAAAPAKDVYWQAVRQGARGVCLILRDQPSNSNTHYGPYDGVMKPLPGLWIGKEDGVELRTLARQGAPAVLTLAGRQEPGTMRNVWGVLPGRSAETILLTSHHDSPFKGVVEDGAGVTQVLAQAWAWAQVPPEDRPKTLVFVVDAGHFYGSQGAHEFARRHADLMKRTRILITLEHLGGKEVTERAHRYVETGLPALTVMFTSAEPTTVASVVRALHAAPARRTAAIPSDLIAPVPTSDASGYVVEAGVPVISWIGCPYYLLDENDTLEMVERGDLVPICRTVTELVKIHQAL